jgi:hypothetical protein
MTSPSLELQSAILARLKVVPAVTALIDGRVYDQVPASAAFPYVSFGPTDELTEDTNCRNGFDISLQIDCWSRAVGFPEVKRVSDAVRAALHDHDFTLTDNALVYFRHRQTRVFRDQDGLTSHAVLTFEAFVEQPEGV